jgi:hypothetical protein
MLPIGSSVGGRGREVVRACSRSICAPWAYLVTIYQSMLLVPAFGPEAREGVWLPSSSGGRVPIVATTVPCHRNVEELLEGLSI